MLLVATTYRFELMMIIKKTPLVFKANLTTSSTTTRQRRQGTHGEGGVRVKKPSTQPRAFFNNLIFQGNLSEEAPRSFARTSFYTCKIG